MGTSHCCTCRGVSVAHLARPAQEQAAIFLQQDQQGGA